MPRRGAHSAREGYRYQDLVTAQYLFRMLKGEPSIRSVRVESPDVVGDIVVKRGMSTDYVEVKEHSPSSSWTVSSLASECFWSHAFQVLNGTRRSRVILISGSPANSVRELTERARIFRKPKEFVSDIEGTSYLRKELQKLSRNVGLPPEELRQLLSKVVVWDSYGSSDAVTERLLESVDSAQAERLLATVLEIVQTGARSSTVFNMTNLSRMINEQGIGIISFRTQLWIDSLAPLVRQCNTRIRDTIAAKLKNKYISRLFVRRDVQQSLEACLLRRASDSMADLDKIISQLRALRINHLIPKDMRQACQTTEADIKRLRNDFAEGRTQGRLERVRNIEQGLYGMAMYDTIQDLKAAVFNLVALVAMAGSGKTNVAASLALGASRKHLCALLLGDELQLESDRSLADRIRENLGLPREISFDAFLEQVEPQLRNEGRKVFIVIDAVNETRDYDLLRKNIENLASHFVFHEVVILITCRDIFWRGFFWSESLPLAGFTKEVLDLGEFTPSEFGEAWRRYRGLFHVNAQLSPSAQNALRHPLLLRFFCETYGKKEAGRTTRRIHDIRLKNLFDEYWSTKLETIRLKLHYRTSAPIDDFLVNLAGLMLRLRKRWLTVEEVSAGISATDMERSDSPYVAILDEGVILERAQVSKDTRVIGFVYEEFMEYVMAKWVYRAVETLAVDELRATLARMMTQRGRSPNLPGTMRYLAVMLREEKNVSLWPDLLRLDHRWSLDALRSIAQLDVDRWDEEAAKTLPYLAALQLTSDDLADYSPELLDLCTKCAELFCSQVSLALKFLTCVPDEDVSSEAVKTLAWLAFDRQRPEARTAISDLIGALDDIVVFGEQYMGARFASVLHEELYLMKKHLPELRFDSYQVLDDMVGQVSYSILAGLLPLEMGFAWPGFRFGPLVRRQAFLGPEGLLVKRPTS